MQRDINSVTQDMLSRIDFDAACNAFIAKHAHASLDDPIAHSSRGWSWSEYPVRRYLTDPYDRYLSIPLLDQWLHVKVYSALPKTNKLSS